MDGVTAKDKEERRAPLLTIRRAIPLPPAHTQREPIGRAGHSGEGGESDTLEGKEQIPMKGYHSVFHLWQYASFFFCNCLKSHWEIEDLGNMPVAKGTFRYLHWSKVRVIHTLSISRLSSSGGSWPRTSTLRRQPWTFQFLGLFFISFMISTNNLTNTVYPIILLDRCWITRCIMELKFHSSPKL